MSCYAGTLVDSPEPNFGDAGSRADAPEPHFDHTGSRANAIDLGLVPLIRG